MGEAQLHGINKRDFLKKKFAAEGRKPLKNQKAPFAMLQGMRKKQNERDVRRRERLKDSGMLRDFQVSSFILFAYEQIDLTSDERVIFFFF